jgi:hypothetical protein
VETGATVAVVFNQPIDPATLTSATFRVTREGVPLPTVLSYEEATRTARAAAPFLPDMTYQVEVTTGVRTPANAALSAPAVWGFTTRAWQAVTVDAAGSVGFFTSLAVDAGGRLHGSYYDDTNRDLKYAACPARCDLAHNWRAATVDAAGSVGLYTSLAVDASGRLHVSYEDRTNSNLKYATCAADCALTANWQAVTVDAAGSVGWYTSLAVGAAGRLHVSYWDTNNDDLKYATCAADCDAAAGWQAVTVDAAGSVGWYTSLAVDAGGRLHVSYLDNTNGTLKYATCAANCETAANWQAATVDAAAGRVGLYTSLAVDAGGRLHVSYQDWTNGHLKYATCAADCALTANWQAATVDAAGSVGFSTSLAVDGSGRLHVSYYDNGNSNLKYIE